MGMAVQIPRAETSLQNKDTGIMGQINTTKMGIMNGKQVVQS